MNAMADKQNDSETVHAKGARETMLHGLRHEIAIDDEAYPEQLKNIRKRPQMLRVIGNPEALQMGVSIIGARKATPYGRGCARRFAAIAAQLGICVISGGALGCDAEAHRGALDSGGTTVAILGGGCDRPYPARNIRLFQSIIDAGGAVVSEQDWKEPPLPWMFRERNRLIAGMSLATLVVEAGLPSGTFSTADEALAVGREVLVVPGSITSATSAGSNRLLAQGALPIVDDDSFESAMSRIYGVLRHEASKTGFATPDDPIVAALMATPMRASEIVAAGLAESYGSLQIILAQYEQRGLICRYPDGRYGPSTAYVKK